MSHRNGGNGRNDERVRTKLCLYKLCRARRRKAKPNLNLKVIGAKKSTPHGLSVISVISAGNKKTSP